jgi:hypothetical protein
MPPRGGITHDGPSRTFRRSRVRSRSRRAPSVPEVQGRPRLAVPLAQRGSHERLPHRPLHQGGEAGEGTAGADPGQPGPGAALAARQAGTRGHRPHSAERRHPYRLRPLLAPQPGTRLAAGRARQVRHRQGQNLQREDQHPDQGPPPVRGGAEDRPGDQGARPALPGHLHRVRDDEAGARRGRTHRPRGPSDRARPGAGDARRPAARHLRSHRPRQAAVRLLRRDGRDRAGEHPGVDAGGTRYRGPQGQVRWPAPGS